MNEQNPLSLSEVQAGFAHWRASGKTRHTPAALREQAVALLASHSMSEVMRTLRVDHRRLSRWRQAFSAVPPPLPQSFVELPSVAMAAPATPTSEPVSASLTLTRQAADGRAVSIGAELPAEHWRWALRLLEQAAL